LVRCFKALALGCQTSVELVRGLSRSRCWWLVPLLLFLLPLALFFVVVQAVPWVAPFVYVVF